MMVLSNKHLNMKKYLLFAFLFYNKIDFTIFLTQYFFFPQNIFELMKQLILFLDNIHKYY